MADLEANFMHLQLMHESLSRFNESFASFLYGMNMNAFCVDFPEVRQPIYIALLASDKAHRHPYQNPSNAPNKTKTLAILQITIAELTLAMRRS